MPPLKVLFITAVGAGLQSRPQNTSLAFKTYLPQLPKIGNFIQTY
jgi:hypothetical protein